MPLARVQTTGLVLLAVAMVGALAWTCASPRFALVHTGGRVPWIAAPEPAVSTGVVAAPWDALHRTDFERVFRSDAARELHIRVEALRGFELRLNDRVLATRAWDEGSWREPVEVDAGPALRRGENRLAIRVRNPTGPALLRLEARGDDVALVSDASWTARFEGGPARPARPADDRLRAAATIASPRLAHSLAERGTWLLGLLAACTTLAFALPGSTGPRLRQRAARAWLPALGALWLALLWRASALAPYVGFDGPDHLAYVHWILEHGTLPLPGDGGQTHHPPLYYLLSAALARGLASLPEGLVLRLLPVACGLAQVALAHALARRLAPDAPGIARAAALGAGLLPLNLAMSILVGNEPLHGALAGLAALATVDWLLRGDATLGRTALLGALAGLAVLAKVTSLLLVPLIVVFVAIRLAGVDRRGLAATSAHVAAAAGGAALVCGGFFVRNAYVLGRALVGNWNVPDHPLAWWQHPGFHTPGYYLRFGHVFERPWFASFESFWDGLYSTFWGDGLVAGVSAWPHRHGLWDYDWMALCYLLALPATAMLLHGLATGAVAAFRDPAPGRRLALSFLLTWVAVSVFAALMITLEVPAYSMTKASYLLALTAPLALAWAVGFTRWRRACAAWPLPRALLDGWAGTFAIAIGWAFLGGAG